MKPKLLVADPNPASRLVALDALREDFDVVPMPEDDDPLRATRHHRPAVLLLAVPGARSAAADGPAVKRFVAGVMAGERPVVRAPGLAKGLLGRLFGR